MGFIENNLIKNELTLRRYRTFKKDRLAVFSVYVLLFLLFMSFTAEFWASNKPHLLKYHGHIYAPLFIDYHPSVFGFENEFVTDYRKLQLEPGDWSIWPVMQWDPLEANTALSEYPSPPSKYNWLGTDDRGRDVLTRLLYGLRYTFIYAISVWLLSYLIGCVAGAIMGYAGGKTDLMGSRIVEVVESMPAFFVIITAVALFTPSLPLLIIINVIFGWTGICSYMRAQFLSLRKREYVEAATAIGSSHWRIISKHIFPNALTPIVTFAPFTVAANVISLAYLDYLGLGLIPPTPSWGELLNQAEKYFTTAEWLVWAPSGALLITLTMLINIGLAVRDAFDSKSAL
jgi:microcin C transport system permease protein